MLGIALLLLASMMIFKRFRPKIISILKSVLEKTFFNNIIKSINLSYLKSLLAFAVAIISLSSDASFGTYFVKVIPLLIFFMIPVTFVYVLRKYRDELHKKSMRDRIERAYIQVHLYRNTWTIYYYPIFLFRRFVFVLIPIIFHGHVTFQL